MRKSSPGRPIRVKTAKDLGRALGMSAVETAGVTGSSRLGRKISTRRAVLPASFFAAPSSINSSSRSSRCRCRHFRAVWQDASVEITGLTDSRVPHFSISCPELSKSG